MMTRKDYVATAEILKYASDKTHPALFSKIVNDFDVETCDCDFGKEQDLFFN